MLNIIVSERFIFLFLVLVIIIIVMMMNININKFTESFGGGGGGPNYKANDPIFDNAQFYQLDLNTTDDITGYPLCLQKCKGVCVQYGVTGSAWCYPSDYEVEPVKDGGTNLKIPKFST